MSSLVTLFVFVCLLGCVTGRIDFIGPHYAKTRVKRDGKLSTRWISRKGGIDVPITLRSLITCTIPGLNDLICLGPRVGLFEPKELTLTKKEGKSFGYNNGVDLRMLGYDNIPLIGPIDTEIGVHDGATVREDGVEFGHQRRIFKAWRDNTGGVVEWGPGGAGVDIGYRGSAADDLVKIQYTLAGITVGNPRQGLAAPPLMPGPRVPSPTTTYWRDLARFYPGGRLQPDVDSWYRSQFRNYGDEYRTPRERACPWCFATDVG
uniref:Secreted protein n=1 Tax=Panagrellus redivivus TaxID=6233 RepID=A0A7E4VFB1_PANRE